ncbi:MAG: glycosyltransferase family 4 protein [Candidatus Aenigmarchaeota archaeon]|nr:glycosyltransferase family 4 protein [Candidatus Aenigmarchaeota archaeon]
MKKKLLITTDCFPPRWDGVARFIVNSIETLKQNFDITVVAPAFDDHLHKIKGIKLLRLPLIPIRFGDIYFALPKYWTIKRLVNDADVVFNQTIGTIGICSILAAKSCNKKIISYIHSIEWQLAAKSVQYFQKTTLRFVKLLTKWIYNKCSLLIVPSRGVEDLLLKNDIITRKIVIPLGVDVKKFMPRNKVLAKKTIGISPSTLVIGFCGRIGREKDVPTLCSAFCLIKKEWRNARLLIVGEGLEMEECKQKGVMITGFVDNVLPYYQAMDIFVLPSLTETSSLVTMEAMACGLPIVVTPVGSIREYVKDGANGLVFARGDVKGLAEQLRLLIRNKSLRHKLGTAARKTIVETRNWNKTITAVVRKLKV